MKDMEGYIGGKERAANIGVGAMRCGVKRSLVVGSDQTARNRMQKASRDSEIKARRYSYQFTAAPKYPHASTYAQALFTFERGALCPHAYTRRSPESIP